MYVCVYLLIIMYVVKLFVCVSFEDASQIGLIL